MRPRDNKYIWCNFLAPAVYCALYDQENNKESVRIEDSEMKGAVVDQSQGQLLPLFFPCLLFYFYFAPLSA